LEAVSLIHTSLVIFSFRQAVGGRFQGVSQTPIDRFEREMRAQFDIYFLFVRVISNLGVRGYTAWL
jgi:hypothetical protein